MSQRQRDHLTLRSSPWYPCPGCGLKYETRSQSLPFFASKKRTSNESSQRPELVECPKFIKLNMSSSVMEIWEMGSALRPPTEDPKVPTSWKCAMRHVSIQVILQPLHGSAILQVGFQILFQSFQRKRRGKWWQLQISNTWRPFCRAICTRESAATPQRCPRLACAKAAAALKDGKQWWKGSQICWRY